MTRLEFNILCGEFLIEPNMALESEAVCEALRNGGDVRQVLTTEF